MAQASRELGISAVTLSKRLRQRRIEPSTDNTYSLRQIVDSQVPGNTAAERSLEAHAVLQEVQANAATLKFQEQAGRLISRTEAHDFMKRLLGAIYRGLEYADLSTEDRVAVLDIVRTQGTQLYAQHGWKLEPTTFSVNGEVVESRRAAWTRGFNIWVAQSFNDKQHGGEKHGDSTQGKSIGA